MLSQTGLYALRSVVALAGTLDRWVSAADLAEALGLPPNYLSKTLHRLAAAGLLESRRGYGGGFRLAAPEDLTLADVIDIFDPVRTGPPCLMRPHPCDPHDPCAVHEEWAGWVASRREAWERTRIADLLGAGPDRTPARSGPPDNGEQDDLFPEDVRP